jgi:hypothetical protein
VSTRPLERRGPRLCRSTVRKGFAFPRNAIKKGSRLRLILEIIRSRAKLIKDRPEFRVLQLPERKGVIVPRTGG